MILNGKFALVTGAAKRLGRSIALSLARSGADVIVHYNRSENEARETAEMIEQIGRRAELLCADLAQPEQIDAMFARLAALLADTPQQLGILVNNASVYRRCPLAQVDLERIWTDYEINFVAPFLLMRDFAYYCDEGCIVNILDQRVATVDPSASTYGFAKKSLRDAMEAAAVEWAPRIRVNAVAPGIVLPPPGVSADRIEPLLRNVPMGQVSTAAEVAEACVFLAQAETITGQIIYVDGGMHLAGPSVREVDEADYSAAD